MSGIVIMHSFKLRDGVSVEDFMLAADAVQNNVKKDYSYQLLRDGDKWADMCIWETEADFQNFIKNMGAVVNNPYIKEFQSYLDQKSISRYRFSVEKSY